MNDDARLRLPREPYPGLRPYLDFEAPLLFGRERQVDDIVDRLAAAQFVAVLGGSGSGKSSLVIAGVVPRLRSYGIPGAGDLWLPMVCTPGTSPLARLARAFAALLRSRGSPVADAERESQIMAALRQEQGLARVMDTYTAELALAPGLDASDARVLMVLDQFEEVFHPGNRGLPDVQALVQAVLDHFFNPHPRCHLVLTMRSEFLNDCAAYLELPDAINKSSYLVRRLGAEELQQAITGPAQRYLRLHARSAAMRGADEAEWGAGFVRERALPDAVRFEPAVVQRLLRDVTAIAHDPDHLPLLQHALARLWQAALQRVDIDSPVPADITEIDLVRAVHANAGVARAGGDEEPLGDSINVLRACIENWPETIYQWHAEADRAGLQRLLQRLGVKDVNTGTYSQQRLRVDDGALLLGPGKTRVDLRLLLSEGYLGSVDYFYWDDSDPANTTLKVSHESLIRGWTRFRRLVDAQSVRQEQFVELLRNVQQWMDSDRPDDLLLEAGAMRRLREGGVADLLGDTQMLAAATPLLAAHRDGATLAPAADDAHHYFFRSDQRLMKAALREKRTRQAFVWTGLATVFFVLLPAALFTLLVMNPTQIRVEQLFEAGKRVASVPAQAVQSRLGESDDALNTLLRAAGLVSQARSGQGSWATRTSQFLFEQLNHLPPIRRQQEFLTGVQELSEPQVNSRLRELLTTVLWPAPAGQAAGRQLGAEVVEARCELGADANAAAADEKTGSWAAGQSLRGRLYSEAAAGGDGRAVFVVERGSSDRALSLYAAHRASAGARCTLGAVLADVPAVRNSSVIFDAGLRHFLFATDTVAGAGPATVVVQELHWNAGADLPAQDLKRTTTLTLSDPAAVEAVRRAAGAQRAQVVPTWDGAARTLAVGDQRWMIFSAQARLMDDPWRSPPAPRLTAPRTDAPCARLAAALPTASGASQTMLQAAGHCLLVRLPLPTRPDQLPRSGTFTLAQDAQVALYIEPSGATLADLALTPANPPAPVAVLNPFARLQAAEVVAGEWRFDGDWLQHHVPGAGSRPPVVRTAPLSTCALARLAGQTLNRPGGC